MAKVKLPEGVTRIVRTGVACEKHGEIAVATTDNGEPVGMITLTLVKEGQTLPRDIDLFYIDRKTGKILDSMRLGKGPQESTGPAQVATKDYRKGWDHIFGTKAEVGSC